MMIAVGSLSITGNQPSAFLCSTLSLPTLPTWCCDRLHFPLEEANVEEGRAAELSGPSR